MGTICGCGCAYCCNCHMCDREPAAAAAGGLAAGDDAPLLDWHTHGGAALDDEDDEDDEDEDDELEDGKSNADLPCKVRAPAEEEDEEEDDDEEEGDDAFEGSADARAGASGSSSTRSTCS